METIMHQKEEIFQVIIGMIKNSTCFKAFTISTKVPEIFMQQFWYTIKKIQGTYSYEFVLANKRCIVDAEVFRKILDICPRVEGKEFTEVQDDDATLTFLIDLGYKDLLHKHTSIIEEDYHEYGLLIPMMLNNRIKQSDSYQMFLKYSTGLIPPKKSKGKGSQGKKTADILCTLSKKARKQTKDNLVLEDQVKQLVGYQGFSTSSQPSLQPQVKELVLNQVLDEEKVTSEVNVILKWGLENESEHSENSQIKSDEEEKKDNYGDADDEDENDDHITNIEDTNDEDAETESDEDEIYKYKIQVHKDVDVEMVMAETIERENKEKDEMTNAAIANIEKTTEEKGDAELARNAMTFEYQVKVSTKLPLPSSSLFVSSGFGIDFLNLSFDVSLTGSPLVLKVLVSVILETIILPPIPKIPTETLVSTARSPPHVTPTISIVQQTTTPIPTPPITTEALTITTVVPESDAFIAVQLRVAKLEKDVSELKKVDHSVEALLLLNPKFQQLLNIILDLKLVMIFESEKSYSEIHKIKKEQAEKQKMPKYTVKSTNKAALKEYDLKSTLYQTMNENKSFNRNPANHALHDLTKALIEDENAMDKRVADTVKNHKRQHDDDKNDDEDPSAGPNQGKKTKRRRTKESKSFMNPSTTKETSKETNANEDVVNDVDCPQDDIAPKTNKPLRDTWFKQPPSDIVEFIVVLRMFTRSFIIKRRVEDLQLGVESYQKKLNMIEPQKTFPNKEFKELYTPTHKPPRVIYKDLNKQKRVMRANELYKFSDGTLKTVRDELHHRILDFCLGYNKEMPRRK
nr:hypothetical protein [Tanacetum cinerariifolium]